MGPLFFLLLDGLDRCAFLDGLDRPIGGDKGLGRGEAKRNPCEQVIPTIVTPLGVTDCVSRTYCRPDGAMIIGHYQRGLHSAVPRFTPA